METSSVPNRCGYRRCRKVVRFVFQSELRELRFCSSSDHRMQVCAEIQPNERGALYETRRLRSSGETRTLLSPSVGKDGILANSFNGSNHDVLSYEEARIMREQLDILSGEVASMTDSLANRMISESDLMHSITAMRNMLSVIRRENRAYERNIEMMRLQEIRINNMLRRRASHLQATRALRLNAIPSGVDALECSICMEAVCMESGGVLACNHPFHVDCIATWVNQDNSNCPVCRASINDCMFTKTDHAEPVA